MARIIIYDPLDSVPNNVTLFAPSGHLPDFSAVIDKLVNPDLSALWTPAGGFIVPKRYWKYDGTSSVIEMNTAEKAIVDTLPSAAFEYVAVSGDGTMDSMIVFERDSTDAVLKFNETTTNWEYGLRGSEVPIIRPTFPIFAEENSGVSVGATNYEFSFGNGATNNAATPSGIPMGVECTLIAISVSARNATAGTSTVSISVVNNGTVVATGGIASGTGTNAEVKNTTQITPDTVNFALGDTLQFLTASTSGTLDDVRVVAWFERTA